MLMKYTGELSLKQAARIIEEFENGSRNGEEWAHDVCLHRGTEKYTQSLLILNQAFKVKSIDRLIRALPFDSHTASDSRRLRR
jgi:hypothetical protein